MNEAAQAARKRLRDDFEFYAKNCVKIRPKVGDLRPFVFNPVQNKLDEIIRRQYEATGKIRIVILKARQQGLSTYTSAYLYWRLSQMKAKKGLVIAHTADSSSTLFDMYRRIHNEVPELLRPSTKYNGKRELTFDILDTGLKIATAGGQGVARGETLNFAHLSEVAFWAADTAANNLNAILQTIPNEADTGIFVESTANGMSGVFADLWRGAVDGSNGFIPFFSPWFDSPEYRETVPVDFERTYEEEDLVALYGLDDHQLKFRRTKIALNGRDAFEQEYPSNADEAFKASGRPVFEPTSIHQLLQAALPVINRLDVEDDVLNPSGIGRLHIFHEKEAGEVYTIGADISGGQRGGDYSVAQIVDSKRRQVAVWRGQVDPDHFAKILNVIGLYYNTALIAAESNNHGLLTNVRLARDLHYPNVFTDVSEGKTEDGYSINLGFRTTSKTKPLIIDRLRAELRQGTIEINDGITLREMLSYVITESGGTEAEAGCHDDTVIALAIANHVLVHRWEPVAFDDQFYITAL